ncbi:uncharacterized protein LOC143242986 [Tachypleus tridentatus]|uniref:uncharacterized protein LOC143242986 n=1 Tax=Tachypleus tridentatus TaxID=6853 RepID=UPI003FD60506
MLPVRSYSVRMKRKNLELEASFRKSMYRRRTPSGTSSLSKKGSNESPSRSSMKRTFPTTVSETSSAASLTAKTSIQLSRSPSISSAKPESSTKEISYDAKSDVREWPSPSPAVRSASMRLDEPGPTESTEKKMSVHQATSAPAYLNILEEQNLVAENIKRSPVVTFEEVPSHGSNSFRHRKKMAPRYRQ